MTVAGNVSIILHQQRDQGPPVLERLKAQKPLEILIVGSPERHTDGVVRFLSEQEAAEAHVHARGAFCIYLKENDHLDPDALSTLAELLSASPKAALAAARVVTYREDADDYHYHNDCWVPAPGYYDPRQIAQALEGRTFSKGLALFRHASLMETPMPWRLSATDPLDHWLRLHLCALHHGLVYTDRKIGLQQEPLPHPHGEPDRLNALLEFLSISEQQTTAAGLARSGVMGQLGLALAHVVLETPLLWTPTAMLLTEQNRYNLAQNNERQRLQSFRCLTRTLREDLLPRVSKAVALCRERGFSRIAVFGAGGHSRHLIDIWRALDGPEIQVVLSSELPIQASFEGVASRALSQLQREEADVVVLSSQTYEAEMYTALAAQSPDMPCIALWDAAKYTKL